MMNDIIVQMMTYVTIQGHPVLPYVMALGGVCLTLSTVIPPPASATSIYGRVYTAVNWMAFNFGRAKNANAPTKGA